MKGRECRWSYRYQYRPTRRYLYRNAARSSRWEESAIDSKKYHWKII